MKATENTLQLLKLDILGTTINWSTLFDGQPYWLWVKLLFRWIKVKQVFLTTAVVDQRSFAMVTRRSFNNCPFLGRLGRTLGLLLFVFVVNSAAFMHGSWNRNICGRGWARCNAILVLHKSLALYLYRSGARYVCGGVLRGSHLVGRVLSSSRQRDTIRHFSPKRGIISSRRCQLWGCLRPRRRCLRRYLCPRRCFVFIGGVRRLSARGCRSCLGDTIEFLHCLVHGTFIRYGVCQMILFRRRRERAEPILISGWHKCKIDRASRRCISVLPNGWWERRHWS